MFKFDPMISFGAVFMACALVYLTMGAGLLGAAVLGFVTALLLLPVIALLHA